MATASFPKIDYGYWFKKYSWEGFSSMNAMILTMKNKKFINKNITQENINKKIQLHIKSYIKKNDDKILFEIFKLIQTWGGKSSGKHTLEMTKNWENKLNNNFFESYKDKYREFVRLIIAGKSIESFYLMTNKKQIPNKLNNTNIGIRIKGLSYSFVPKHICFWSGLGDRTKGLPILDDIIAKIVYKVNKAELVDYKTFISDMELQVKALNKKIPKGKYTSTQIEMALFAFSGNYWKTKSTGTSLIKEERKIKNKDLSQVKLIAKLIENKINTNAKLNINQIKDDKNIKDQINFKSKEDLEYKINGSNGKTYNVFNKLGKYSCTCSANKYKPAIDCKHILSIKNRSI
jgi:hypothetical protein